MTEKHFTAADGTIININVWDEVCKPIGAVYIAHGMAEYAMRYERFAKRLNEEGYVVWAADERGHGKSTKTRGVVEENSFDKTVEDTLTAVRMMKETYQTKVFLFGHSYGSAVAQRFLQLYSTEVFGAILSGTSYFKCPATMLGRVVAAIGKRVKGAESPAKLIESLSFKIYNKPYKQEGANAWVSRDKAEVKKYNDSPDCGFTLSYGFYDAFFKRALAMYQEDFSTVRKDLKLMIVVGACDPVSESGKLAKKLYEKYLALGLDATLKMYEGARHEILNETNKEEVTEDIVRFINFCSEDKQ